MTTPLSVSVDAGIDGLVVPLPAVPGAWPAKGPERDVGYRSANKMAFSAKYRFVWCPKYRGKVLVGPAGERLEEIIAEVAGEVGGDVLEVEVMPDLVWRRRGQHEGFCVRDVTVGRLNRRWAEVVIPKAGRVRFRLSRALPDGKPGMARVTLDGKGRWHVSFPGERAPVARERTGAVVGSTVA